MSEEAAASMRVWIIADEEGEEYEAASLAEAIENFVVQWWCAVSPKAPSREALITAQEIVTACPACGSDYLSPHCGVFIRCGDCDTVTEPKVLESVEEVPDVRDDWALR